jgi:hypothetical protein
MIRYSITEEDLRQQIEATKPGWLDRAKTRTDNFLAAGKYDESSSIWSEIKTVYMELQHDKCAYCERQLAGQQDGGTIEHDLEHYRPKNSVPDWPTADMANAGVSFGFSTGSELEHGYFWLAYHPFNYCTSCKKCNSPLKSNYFPIAGDRGDTADSPAALNDVERPFLVYPIGQLDEDPEDLITFVGLIPRPVKRNGPRWRRAQVTIKFFNLDTREELLRERARCLVALDDKFAILDSDVPESRKTMARADIATLRSPASPHSNCVRSACRVYVDDPDGMIQLFQAAREYLASELPSDDGT